MYSEDYLEFEKDKSEEDISKIKILIKGKVDLASCVIEYMSLHEVFDLIANCDKNRELIIKIMLEMDYDIDVIDGYIDTLHFTKEEIEMHNRITAFLFDNKILPIKKES